MKKVVLILLILVLPLQAFAAMERDLAHMLGGGGPGLEFILKHITKHVDLVMHHHDSDGLIVDDSAPHGDNSKKSVQHLADYEHGYNMNTLLPAFNQLGLPAIERIAPVSYTHLRAHET